MHAQLYFGCCDLDSLNPLVCVQYPVSVIKKEKQSMLHYFYATFSKQCRKTLTKHFRQDLMGLSKIEHKLERTRLNQIEFNHIKKILWINFSEENIHFCVVKAKEKKLIYLLLLYFHGYRDRTEKNGFNFQKEFFNQHMFTALHYIICIVLCNSIVSLHFEEIK